MLKSKLNIAAGLALTGASIFNNGCSPRENIGEETSLLSPTFTAQSSDAITKGEVEELLLNLQRNPPHGMLEKPGLWVPNSDKLIIQIDMVHGRPWMSEQEIELLQPHMKRVRASIMHILKVLDGNEIFHDGITEEFLFRFTDSKIAAERSLNDGSKFDLYCKMSPAFKLLRDGVISILPTEFELYVDSSSFDPTDELGISLRESEMLNNIATHAKPYALIVLGADHDLRDNIQRRNEAYSEKFSYIRLRTNDLPVEDTEIENWILKTLHLQSEKKTER